MRSCLCVVCAVLLIAIAFAAIVSIIAGSGPKEASAGWTEVGRYSVSCAWNAASSSVECYRLDTATGAVLRVK